MTMVTETRGEIGAREIEYKRGGEARVGIKPGDVVAFVTPDESHPYVCVDEIDEARDGQRKYRFVIDAEGKIEKIYKKVKAATMADDILKDLELAG